MKFHGLVIIAALCLSKTLQAQNGVGATNGGFLPPSPQGPLSAKEEPLQLPQTTNAIPPAPPVDMDAELKQFRTELREFQAMREDMSRASKTADADADRVTLQQRQELVELLTKLATKGSKVQKGRNSDPLLDNDSKSSRSVPAPPPIEPPGVPMLSESAMSDTSSDLVDPFALGKVLFKAGDFLGAERAFRKANVETENEMTLKYLLATCVRRQSRWKEAMSLYKSIADSNQDPVLRDLAKWQLDNIRWIQESESQLDKMRKQRGQQNKNTESRP